MADINITGNGTFAGNDFTVPPGDLAVTFHSADADVTLCFSNHSTFDSWSLSLDKGGQPTSLTIQTRADTNYTINISGTNCPQGASLKDDTTYTIDMSSPMGGSHQGHHKH